MGSLRSLRSQSVRLAERHITIAHCLSSNFLAEIPELQPFFHRPGIVRHCNGDTYSPILVFFQMRYHLYLHSHSDPSQMRLIHSGRDLYDMVEPLLRFLRGD